jgi:hypothetical protein
MLLKNRTLICVCLSIPLLILGSLLRPEETAILPFSYDPMHTTGAVSERFWVMKAQGMSRYDMILMGDSRVYRGLSPQAMEEVLPGERILNFGFSGGGLNPEMYRAAEVRLAAGSKAKSMVLGITPLTLTPRAEFNAHYLQEVQRPPDYVFLHLYWMPFLKLFEPLTLRDFAAAFSGQQDHPAYTGYYLEFHDDGWVASWTVPEDPTGALPSYREIFSQTQVSQRLVDDLMNQTRTWCAKGIQVYAFRVPTSPAMLRLENQMSGFDEAAFIQQFTAAGGVWFDLPLAPYHSYDGSHLSKLAAVQLSTDLARLITASRGG